MVSRLTGFVDGAFPVFSEAFMYPFTMVTKCVETRKTFVAELADDRCGSNGLAGLLQTSGLCNAAVVIMLRQTL